MSHRKGEEWKDVLGRSVRIVESTPPDVALEAPYDGIVSIRRRDRLKSHLKRTLRGSEQKRRDVIAVGSTKTDPDKGRGHHRIRAHMTRLRRNSDPEPPGTSPNESPKNDGEADSRGAYVANPQDHEDVKKMRDSEEGLIMEEIESVTEPESDFDVSTAIVGAEKTIHRVLSNVRREGALLRNLSERNASASSDQRLSESAVAYGRATVQYNKALADEDGDAAKTLGQIFRHFEARHLQIFCNAYEKTGKLDNVGFENTPTQLDMALNASMELLTETKILWDNSSKKKLRFTMPRGFRPHASIDIVWTASILSICGRQVSSLTRRMTGGQELELTVTELLDVITWIEYCQDIVERFDPELSSRLRAQGRNMSHVDMIDSSAQPRLFLHDATGVTEEDAEYGLNWVYAALTDMHMQARDELLTRTQRQTLEWASFAYKTKHIVNERADGQLFTSLPEDIFSLISTQLRTICDRLPLSSEVLPTVIFVILSSIRDVQLREGGNRMEGFRRCCAAANDYERMSEGWEAITSGILQAYLPQFEGANEHSKPGSSNRGEARVALEEASSELIRVFTSDAVRAAKSLIIPVFEPIRSAIEQRLFSIEWEENYTQNELTKTLTATVEDFLEDLEIFLGSFLLQKAAGALISASVVFYIECLLKNAGGHGGVQASRFVDNHRALCRMNGDMKVMRLYFDEVANRIPALGGTPGFDFSVLTTFHELMSIAAGQEVGEASNFILLLQKRIRNVEMTRRVVKDIWALMAPRGKKKILETMDLMKPHLVAIAPSDAMRATREQEKLQIPGLRLDDMLLTLYSTQKDSGHFGYLRRGLVTKSEETFTRGKHNISRTTEKLARATAKLGVGFMVQSHIQTSEENIPEQAGVLVQVTDSLKER
eukprot:CAMPEP_0197439084 /NCGR_PEP_ID=MMETSP1175-20131217/5895_1 /TAXON_ID=1003142 /ORGANISM="Triceratium dubium, Strain CCMP147" /LENGTH=887 /DNA_ID=CAMNT_0042968917 /DNA_START=80 /DNA_END=2743 /DNA_ORIENTATION=-